MSGLFRKTEKKVDEAVTEVEEVITEVEEATVRRTREVMDMVRHFLRLEASGGIILVMAAALALVIANTLLSDFYYHVLNEVKFAIGFTSAESGLDLEIKKSLLLWINDGLMAVFFFLVGLEIKREFVEGELSKRHQAILPMLAAVGGMAVPAAIYWFINRDTPENLAGWAIPAATDIAFALGILALVGSRAPTSLKILLTAIAIIDDLGAILIIAIFYSEQILMTPMFFAAAALVCLFILNRKGISRLAPYILTGIVLWVAVLESGIHATLAGVITAFFIPMHCRKMPGYSPCKHLEHSLHPWIAFGVLPVFAFANAGVPFAGMGVSDLLDPVVLGIALGLIFGKQIGIFVVIWLTVKLGLSTRPPGTTWLQLYAVSILCGIGFTMSLFIGGLAFDSLDMQASVRMGVLIGSIISATLAYIILRYGSKPKGVEHATQNTDHAGPR